MTIEIERKFLVTDEPDGARLGPGVSMRQGYVVADGRVTVRVRTTPSGSWLTLKAGDGLTRTEIEVEVSATDAEALWSLTDGRHIDKVRHRLALGGPAGLVAELDVFAGELAGLELVEVEFGSVEAAEGFDPPAWFGDEVTADPGWTNAALSLHGRPSPAEPTAPGD